MKAETRIVRAILADDEPVLLDYLQQKLSQYWPELQIVATANNGLAALALIRQYQPELVLLDIQMPGLTGLQVAAQLAAPQSGQPPCQSRWVFITAYDEYAVQAFEQAALDYLLKPVTDERLQHCIRRLQATFAQQPALPTPLQLQQQLQQLLQHLSPTVAPLQWFHVGLAQQTRLVHLSEVLFFQACDKYTELVTRHERHLLRMSLKTLLQKLPAGQYAQVHRAFLVAFAAVRYIEKDIFGRQHIHLKDHPQLLPLSRTYAGQFKQM